MNLAIQTETAIDRSPKFEKPPGVFFAPSYEFVKYIVGQIKPTSVVIDIGAGTGWTSARIVYELRMRPSPSRYVIALDTWDSGKLFGCYHNVICLDGTRFPYREGMIPILCRPCHGGFAEAIIRAAVPLAGYLFYVGLDRNYESDLGFLAEPDASERFAIERISELDNIAGFDGESVWKITTKGTNEMLFREKESDESVLTDTPLAPNAIPRFGPTFERVVRIRSLIELDPDRRKELIVGLKRDRRYPTEMQMHWDCGQSYCPLSETEWEIICDYNRLPDEDEDDAIARIFEEDDECRIPNPSEPTARCGYIAPNGDWFPCAYCAHRDLCRLLSLRYVPREDRERGKDIDNFDWVAVKANGLMTSRDNVFTQAQVDTAKKLLAAYEAAEVLGVDIARELEKNPESYRVQDSWSRAWDSDALEHMRTTIEWAEESLASGAPPIRMADRIDAEVAADLLRLQSQRAVPNVRSLRDDLTPDGD